MDPKLIEALVPNKVVEEGKKITADEPWLLDDMPGDLIRREKDVFTLVKAEGLTFEYMAELLGITNHLPRHTLNGQIRKLKTEKCEPFSCVLKKAFYIYL
ncbi:hypothetical protein [Domibacillus iocasae]|uniref:Uncharacterized protein n=1 Tax=Domibacillus iocasae TaxID=1714016 RepID=A0A1E7DR37_9BACI|nr:hypothetical protein [Domibacillus iocasae]OES45524.1 hypothetical protein BA724_01515 [Domibacillus iocasae]